MHRIECGLLPMENKWADMTFAETQIALGASRGVKEIENPDDLQNDANEPDDNSLSDQDGSDSFNN